MADLPPNELPDGRLTEDQRKKVLDWFNSKTPLIGKCPLCSDRRWMILDHLVHAPIFTPGVMTMGGPAYPNVGIVCQNCGNTQYVNAMIAGVLEDGREKTTPPGGGADE